MLLDQGKELLGNTLFTVGDIYEIAYPCNHHDLQMVLRNPKYIDLVPGNEVQFVAKVSKREGVFARVRSTSSNVVYDIYYTNLGGLSQCVSQEKKPKSKAELKKQQMLEKKLARLLKKKIKLEELTNG